MSNNIVINEKKKALLAYKEKLLEEIKYYERSIDDFRTNHKNNSFCDDHVDSSDSEDDFPCAIEAGPSITQLKLQQAMMKTCLHATQELTSLMVLQSEVDVLIEEPKFEGERPVTEAGTWREVTAECRIDLVPFTMTFFMHTPDRKFAPPSYRGLRVVPVKSTHEMELSKSVLHSLKVPSDAVEVLRSYAAGYRSRRTTLARLANKYTNSLFMEPHAEGGFVLKCADLLEVSWRLENKWSPVAPFHHRMKFDLEYMDECYIKIITQAHKQLLDPTLQADDRTLLLAKIITTCLEARGPIDPESDLESKTTERDNDMDKRDSENEKRDSEVMAPPKSLPKKGKQKSKDSLQSNAQKRSIDDDDDRPNGAKKIKSNIPIEAKKSIADNNPRKSKITEEIGKKRKINEVNKVSSVKNVIDTADVVDGNTKAKEIEDKTIKTQSKPNIVKESAIAEDRSTIKAKNDVPIEAKKSIVDNNTRKTKTNDPVTEIGKKRKINEVTKVTSAKNVKDTGNEEDGNTKTKEITQKTHSKPKIVKESVIADDVKAITKVTKENIETTAKDTNSKPKTKNLKEPANTKSKAKILKDIGKNQETENNDNPKHGQKDSATKNKMIKESTDTNIVNKAKNMTSKEAANTDINNANTKTIDKKKIKNVAQAKSKENIDSNKINKDTDRPKSKIAEKASVGKNIHTDEKNKNTDAAKVKVASTKNEQTAKKAPERNTNVATSKNDNKVKKDSEKNDKNKDKIQEVANKGSEKSVKEKIVNNKVKNDQNAPTVKKVTEKNATNIKNKDRISQITTKVTEKVVKDKPALTDVPEKALNSNLITKNIKDNKNIKKPIIHKIASHRNSLKPQNPPKTFKDGNTKSFTAGNTDKENGGKLTKIPQKKLSIISEGSSKKNMLRMSPRQIQSKFKTVSHETFKQKMVKATNIPRLLKKPAPKV